MRNKKFDFRTAYIDLLLNVLTGIIFLFMVATVLIKPEAVKDAGIKKDAEYIINLSWPTDKDCDVDIWVRDPLGNVVSFIQKDLGIMHLERDDLGSANDKVKTDNGFIYSTSLANDETWVLRGMIPGKFTVNLHLYACRDAQGISTGVGSAADVKAKVELIKINPDYISLKTVIVAFNEVWQEQTAFNFLLDDKGQVTSIDQIYNKIIKYDTIPWHS